jgi:hypothetical protein
VAHPDDVIGVAVVDKTVDMDTVKRIIYFEAAYTEIKRAHGQDHTKGARNMLVLGNSLRTSDVNCVRCSPACALFASPK